MKWISIGAVLLKSVSPFNAPDLDLTPQPDGSRGGSEFARSIVDLSQQEREERILVEWE